MNVKHTRVEHEGAGHWVVIFSGDDGQAISVRLRHFELSDRDKIVEHAKRVMSELTGVEPRGGKRTLNRYDALGNGDPGSDDASSTTAQ